MKINIKKSGGRQRFLSVILAVLIISAALFTPALAQGESGSDVTEVCVGGFPFGVRLSSDGVMVTGIRAVSSDGKAVSPCEMAGIRVGDLIIKVEDVTVEDATVLSEVVERCGGEALDITLKRDGKTLELSLTPVREDGSGIYRAGMELRDSISGIGTVTYYMPDTLEFGGLGHGICDATTMAVVPIKRGSAMAVEIGGVVKGKAGRPGEIKGSFLPKRTGSILLNTDKGVFGVFSQTPSVEKRACIGKRDEVKEGAATLLTTLGDDGIKEYGIEISKINRDSTDNKSFVITVTDKALKERTGGIIQGMSGSPIIQNGKLVGAVTHVLVNDPTRGYGIFIENMLNEAQMPMQRAA